MRARSSTFIGHLGMSEAVQLTGLTERAIRFYEQRGLIRVVRDRNNCRQYDVEARGLLLRIAELRRHGLALARIAEILRADDEGRGKALTIHLLTNRRDELVQQLNSLEDTLGRLAAEPSESTRDAVPLRMSA